MVQGVSVDNLIEVNSDANSRYNMTNIKSAIVLEFNSFMPSEIKSSDLTTISVVGRTKKHLKVTTSSVFTKNDIVRYSRMFKPTNFYVNEYLTKKRSSILYRLRCLRKTYESVVAVYSKNGHVYYKLSTDAADQHHRVSEVSELDTIEEGLKRETEATSASV